MNMEMINFNKSKEYENGEKFEFRFEGLISNQNIDREKIDKSIDSFINKQNNYNDMLRNVTILRTILKDFSEKFLVVEYKDANGTREIVKYDHTKLSYLECNYKKKESGNTLTTTFTADEKVNISFTDFDVSLIDYPNSKIIKEKVNDFLKHIRLLKKVEAISLDKNAKTIIEIYKLFYDENPDFSKEDINIKIQTMLTILNQFNISSRNYCFEINDKMPESYTLQKTVNKLFPLGEVDVLEECIELNPKVKETIQIVGKTIRETVHDNQDINEVLISISKTIYAGRYNIGPTQDVKKIIEYPNVDLTYTEADSNIGLVKTIKRKLSLHDLI